MCNREASGEIRVQIQKGGDMTELLRKIWQDDEGQDIAEYAVVLAVAVLFFQLAPASQPGRVT